MTTTKKLLFIPILLMLCISLKAQVEEPKDMVKWLSFEKAQELNKIQAKPFLIDCYTDWCGWCKYMAKTTFANPDIANYINNFYYPVRFNAEGFDTIMFQGEKYFNKTKLSRSTHDLAIKLLDGKLSYPTMVYYNNDFKFKLIVPGYMSSSEIEPFLVYTVEYVFNSAGAQEFATCYKRAYHPDSTFADTAAVKWISLTKATELNKTKPKKLLIFTGAPFCNSGKVMLGSTFRYKYIADYVTKNFYPVYFDAVSTDTVTYNGQVFAGAGNGQIHQFATYISAGKLFLPTLSFVDTDYKLITNVPQFMTAESLEPVLKFIFDDSYKTVKWEDYVKDFKSSLKK